MSVAQKLHKALCVLVSLDRRWLRALRRGVAPSLEHQRVLGLIEPRLVVDIGANRGQFALAVRHAHPTATILSFEPLPGPAASYRKVFAGDERVKLVESAVGPEAGAAPMHVSGRDDSSSLLPIAAMQDELFPGTAEAAVCSIHVTRLAEHLVDESINAPALLKLDVQGFELEALRGCEDLLRRFAWVYVECSFVELYVGQAFAGAIIAWLRERGFKLRGVYNMTYGPDGAAVQADFLFASGTSTRTTA